MRFNTKRNGRELLDYLYSIELEGFWYAISEGYVKPREILADNDDIVKLEEAIRVLQDFESVCLEKCDELGSRMDLDAF